MGASISVITWCGSANANTARAHIRGCATVAIITGSAVNAWLRNQAISVVVADGAIGSGIKVIAGQAKIGWNAANSANTYVNEAD